MLSSVQSLISPPLRMIGAAGDGIAGVFVGGALEASSNGIRSAITESFLDDGTVGSAEEGATDVTDYGIL
eukprot:IDg8187t1